MDLDSKMYLEGEKNQCWNLLDTKPIELGEHKIDEQAMPFIAAGEQWDQYQDEVIYQADKLMREWLEKMSQDPYWCASHKHRTYKFSQLFEMLYHQKYDTKKHAKFTYKIRQVLAYYSTKINKNYYNRETQRTENKAAYTIEKNALDRPPYSIRLRIPWMVEHGVAINDKTLAIPNVLSPGHAKNPKTEANMQLRRRRAQDAYTEYQRQRRNRNSER